jgi:hypothetical protein
VNPSADDRRRQLEELRKVPEAAKDLARAMRTAAAVLESAPKDRGILSSPLNAQRVLESLLYPENEPERCSDLATVDVVGPAVCRQDLLDGVRVIMIRYEPLRIQRDNPGDQPVLPDDAARNADALDRAAEELAGLIDRAHATARPPPPPRGKPGRIGYPRKEIIEYVGELQRKDAHIKSAALWNACGNRFGRDNVPENANAFRAWLSRQRRKRTN